MLGCGNVLLWRIGVCIVLVCLYLGVYVLEDTCVGLWECGVSMMGLLCVRGFLCIGGPMG